jgi:hypothetical protein
MFYCEPCRVDFAWPESVARSRGKCEVCGQHAACYDRPSDSLPDPAACETTSGCVYGRGHQRRGMEPCRVEERFVEQHAEVYAIGAISDLKRAALLGRGKKTTTFLSGDATRRLAEWLASGEREPLRFPHRSTEGGTTIERAPEGDGIFIRVES